MTHEEMTRRGIALEARRGSTRDDGMAYVAATVGIIALLALGLVFASVKRAERDSKAEMDHAHYELMAATGGRA